MVRLKKKKKKWSSGVNDLIRDLFVVAEGYLLNCRSRGSNKHCHQLHWVYKPYSVLLSLGSPCNSVHKVIYLRGQDISLAQSVMRK